MSNSISLSAEEIFEDIKGVIKAVNLRSKRNEQNEKQ